MKRAIVVAALLVLIVPTVVHAACGDGVLGGAEECDPRAVEVENLGCSVGYICVPATCQCVVDYAARRCPDGSYNCPPMRGDEAKKETTKKKVRMKK